ncbi:MAG: hypothetical protein KF858_10595 [Candidatus Sumerlaeia bacterium]|nr:hypothetical protein [Candidatus Sumerlaeia bacterium]
MRHAACRLLSPAMVVVVALLWAGCANFIRQDSDVIWDRIEGTEALKLESLRVEGARVQANLRYTCERRQFAVTNVYETPWSGLAELYEVPVGVVAVLPAFVWYIGSELVTLGAVESKHSAKPLNWSVAGLNPFLPVEGGMFVERYRIREKAGSRRPQEGSKAEPYDAAVSIDRGRAEVRFVRPGGQAGPWVTLDVGQELLIELNLLEAAWAIPAPDAARVELRGTIRPSRDLKPTRKSVQVVIDPELAGRLHEVRETMRAWRKTGNRAKRAALLEQVAAKGFVREAAELGYR